MELNEQQLAAVSQLDGPTLVLAGPGSGKTRVLAARAEQLVRDGQRFTAVTFTRKAAREMRGRLVRAVGDRAARQGFVGTFHAWCWSVLKASGQAVGLPRDWRVADETAVLALIAKALVECGLDDGVYSPQDVASEISRRKNRMAWPGTTPPATRHDARVDELYRAYRQLLRKRHLIDFDDLLLYTWWLLDHHPEAVERHCQPVAYLLVDEFQDTNAVQYRLMRHLSHAGNVFVVCDDDQAIYAWRGANVEGIRQFKQDHPGCAVHELGQNYRSTQAIVGGALKIAAPLKQRVDKRLWTERPEGDPIRVQAFDSDHAEAEAIAAEIAAHLAAGGRAQDCAVLYRIHRVGLLVKKALDTRKIPHHAVGDSVTVTTLHQSKGLEWERVWLVGVEQGILPSRHCRDDAEIDDERRLLYVGMTRARDGLALTAAFSRTSASGTQLPARPSRFLEALAA